jgi:hypothetical protein
LLGNKNNAQGGLRAPGFVKGAMAMGIPLITEMNFSFGTGYGIKWPNEFASESSFC